MRKEVLIIACLLIQVSLHTQVCIHTYAGLGTMGNSNGSLSISEFNNPAGICRSENGTLFIADMGNHLIRKIENGIVSNYAGNGTAAYADGTAFTASFNEPFYLCLDDSNNLYISDFSNHRIRKVSASGMVSTIAGSGIAGYMDGTTTSAQFNYPRGIVWDKAGYLYIGDSWNHRIRRIDLRNALVTTYAGGGATMGVGSIGSFLDGPDTSARFYVPCGLSMDEDRNLYVADAYNHRIRKIDTSGYVLNFAGNGPSGSTSGSYADGYDSSALFNTPTDLYYAKDKGLYIGDTYNNRIRKVDLSGFVSSILGNGIAGDLDSCNVNFSQLNHPRGLWVSQNSDTIFLVDGNNHKIKLQHPELSGWEDFPKTKENLIRLTYQDDFCLQALRPIHQLVINIYQMGAEKTLEQKLKKMDIKECYSLSTNASPGTIFILHLRCAEGEQTLKFIQP